MPSSSDHPTPPAYTAANAIIRMGTIGLIAFLAARARKVTVLRERVRTLEGILPICSYCKAIRDATGHWAQLEAYISRRTHFTHGVCPTCEQKHYGDLDDLRVPSDQG